MRFAVWCYYIDIHVFLLCRKYAIRMRCSCMFVRHMNTNTHIHSWFSCMHVVVYRSSKDKHMNVIAMICILLCTQVHSSIHKHMDVIALVYIYLYVHACDTSYMHAYTYMHESICTVIHDIDMYVLVCTRLQYASMLLKPSLYAHTTLAYSISITTDLSGQINIYT